METKQCSQCKEIKTLDQLSPHYNKKPGVRLAYCKKCGYRLYIRPTHLKRLARQGKKPREILTVEEIKRRRSEAQKAYRKTEAGKARQKRYLSKLKANRPVTVKAPKTPKIKSPEQIELEKQKAKEYRRKYRERTYLKKQLDKGLTIGPTIAMLGCSIAAFRAYIEAQFTRGMTWDNYGTLWHIDHIKPICSFDLKEEGIAAKVNHYSNLRPLIAEDNLEKSKIDVTLKFKRGI